MREIIRKRDSELEQRRQGLADPSDIYKRIGFWNYFQPNLDHVAEVGRVRAECLRKAYSQDGQKLSQAVIDEILSDALEVDADAVGVQGEPLREPGCRDGGLQLAEQLVQPRPRGLGERIAA